MHIVKCLYCGQCFDAKPDEEGTVWTKPRSNRYAHITCQDNKLTKEEKEFDELYRYVKEEQGDNFNFIQFKKLVEFWKKSYNYSYSGILKSLQWYYDIQKNPKDKFKEGSLGIVPYVYTQAYNYFYKIYLAAQKNNDKEYSKKTRTVKIKSPRREGKKPFLFFENED